MLISYLFFQFLLLALTGIFSFCIGKAIFGKDSAFDSIQAIAIFTPAGLAILVLALFFLGLLHLLTLPYVLITMVLMGAAAVYKLNHQGSDAGETTFSRRQPLHLIAGQAHRLFVRVRQLSLFQWLLILSLLLILVPVLLTPVTPPVRSDEIRYHLPYALHFMKVQGIEPNLALRYPFFSLNINLLYTYGLLIGDDISPHFLHCFLGFLAAINCYVLTREYTGKALALGAALLFLTLPIISRLSNTAYIDLGLACFIFSSMVCASTLKKSSSLPLVLCSALLLGVGIGSKYLGLAYFPILVLWAGYWSRSWKTAGYFALFALLSGSPWYIYNFILSGNPVSPFLGELFGYWPFSELDMQVQREDLGNQGLDQSLISLLLLPYNLLVKFRAFDLPQPPLLLIPALLMLPFTPWLDKNIRPWLVLLLSAILIWFFSSQSFRYLTLILPLWCFLSVWLIKSLGDGFSSLLGRWTPISIPGLWISLAILFVGISHQYANNRFLNYPADVVAKVTNRETYLTRSLDEYELIRFINNSDIRGETIFQLRAGAMLSYVRGNRVIGDVMGLYGMLGYASKYAASKEGFVEEMAEQDVSHWVFRQNFLRRQADWGEYLRKNLDITYEDELFVLFSRRADNIL